MISIHHHTTELSDIFIADGVIITHPKFRQTDWDVSAKPFDGEPYFRVDREDQVIELFKNQRLLNQKDAW